MFTSVPFKTVSDYDYNKLKIWLQYCLKRNIRKAFGKHVTGVARTRDLPENGAGKKSPGLCGGFLHVLRHPWVKLMRSRINTIAW